MEARKNVCLFLSLALLLHGMSMLSPVGAYLGLTDDYDNTLPKQKAVEAMLMIAFIFYFLGIVTIVLTYMTRSTKQKGLVRFAGLYGILGGEENVNSKERLTLVTLN